MNFIKTYIRPERSTNSTAPGPVIQVTAPDSNASMRPRLPQNLSTTSSGLSSPGYSASRTSLHPDGDFRNNAQREIEEIKSTVAINWVYQQQGENMWNNGGVSEGVVLRKAPREFMACPGDLIHIRGGLFDGASVLNAKASSCQILDELELTGR